MPKRKDRVAPPPVGDEWDVKYLTTEAVRGWEELCRLAPGPTKECWNVLRTSPDKSVNTSRHHPLKGTLREKVVGGKPLVQWQYEVTGGGRVWFCPDPDTKTVWLSDAGTGHPKATE